MTNKISIQLKNKIKKIKLVFTDNDGVLTDTGVYYSDEGEMFKRFSIRDGMGVERLRNILGIETGIITGEVSGSIKKRQSTASRASQATETPSRTCCCNISACRQ